MNFLDLKNQIVHLWKQTSILKRISWGILILIICLGLVLIYSRAHKVEYVTLYSGLEANEAGAIVEKLKSNKIPYRIMEGGKIILVSEEKADEVRLKLAKEGLPRKDVGYEIFDKRSWGATDFVQKVNYKRALEGELARTITQLKEVESVRVHLVLPEERLFKENQKEPSASVLVKLRPGEKLLNQQVLGIASLLAHSIEGLSPSNISIIDYSGNLLFPGEEALPSENLSSSATQSRKSETNHLSDLYSKDTDVGKKGVNYRSNLLQRYLKLSPLVLIPFIVFWIIKAFRSRKFSYAQSAKEKDQDELESMGGRAEFEAELKELEFLRDENPQTISIILAQLKPSVAATILNLLPAEKQIRVVLNLSRIEQVPSEIKKRVWQAMKTEQKNEKIWHPDFLTEMKPENGEQVLKEILRFARPFTRRRILQGIKKEKTLTYNQ